MCDPILPQDGMTRRETADLLIARSRNADDLTVVVDSRRRAVGIASVRRQLMDRVSRAGFPNDRKELQDVTGSDARRIVIGRLRPSNNSAALVDAGGIAVAAAQRGE